MWVHPVGKPPPPFVYGDAAPYARDLPPSAPIALHHLGKVLEDAYAGTCLTFPKKMTARPPAHHCPMA